MGPYARAGGNSHTAVCEEKLTPRALLSFPWDAESTTAYGEKAEYLSKEDSLRRFEQMLEKDNEG